MKIKRDRVRKYPVPENWHERVVVLWTEDECLRNDDTAEHLDSGPFSSVLGPGAFMRITGHARPQFYLAEADLGDTFMYLYEGGWVAIEAYNGTGVGVLVEVVP